MAFITDKEQLKPGLIIFRRTDVQHNNWYCRMKLPKADRYKTVSLKTSDLQAARNKAFDHDADIRFRIKHDVPVFNRPFADVGREYFKEQELRALRGEVSKKRPDKIKSILDGPLNAYVGSTQVHLIGDETWTKYPVWRRENGKGRFRNGVMSDSTINFEMSIFAAVMNFAIKKRYVSVSQRFSAKPKLETMRRDEFTREEYRKLHTVAREKWIGVSKKPASIWYRTVAYNFVLIMCNTGMRPSEAKNLRWRDVMPAKDRDGNDIVVLFVQGKGKSRKLVAPKSVGDYLDRIRKISKATKPDDSVFTMITGKPAKWLYQSLIKSLLNVAGLRDGPNGVPRSTYCFRHTYATLRLSEGVDVYFLAEQMGTSVKMIEDHYGHVNTIRHADRVLLGMHGWNPESTDDGENSKDQNKDKARAGAKGRAKQKHPRSNFGRRK